MAYGGGCGNDYLSHLTHIWEAKSENMSSIQQDCYYLPIFHVHIMFYNRYPQQSKEAEENTGKHKTWGDV